MIVVIAGIIQKNKQILIARRARHKSLAGYWEFPGGKLEAGETPEGCLQRELREELNINVVVDQFFMTTKYDYGTFQIQLHAYLCRYIDGVITLSDHDQMIWIEKKALLDFQWAPADIPIVQALDFM